MNNLLNPLVFWLISARLGGFLTFCPGFYSDEMPAPHTMKALLVGWLSVSIMPSVLVPRALLTATIPDLLAAMICEFLLGMGAALALRLVFASVRIGGTLMDSELSFLSAEQFNPAISMHGGVMNRFLGLSALFYFWVLDYASLLIFAVAKSFALVPLGSLQLGMSGNYSLLVKLGSNSFVSGLVIAAPIIAMMFFLNVTIGFLARLVQGINVFFESFTLRIIVGSLGIILFLPLILMMVRNQIEKMLPTLNAFFQNAAL
jgi:flagellar biosynthesis protein FliR